MITAVLLGVIAMTILSPDDQNELFGVNVPEQRIEPPGSGQDGDGDDDAGDRNADRNRDEDDAGDEESGGDGPPGAAVAGTGGAGLTAPGTTPVGPLSGEPADDDDGEAGPADEQYDDTLARLGAAVD